MSDSEEANAKQQSKEEDSYLQIIEPLANDQVEWKRECYTINRPDMLKLLYDLGQLIPDLWMIIITYLPICAHTHKLDVRDWSKRPKENDALFHRMLGWLDGKECLFFMWSRSNVSQRQCYRGPFIVDAHLEHVPSMSSGYAADWWHKEHKQEILQSKLPVVIFGSGGGVFQQGFPANIPTVLIVIDTLGTIVY